MTKVILDAVAKVPFCLVSVVSSDRYERHNFFPPMLDVPFNVPNAASQQFDDVCLSAIGSNTIWTGAGD